MADQPSNESESDAGFAELLKWPIIFILAVTSFPAGFLPCATAIEIRELHQDERGNPKLRNEARLENERSSLWMVVAATIGFGLVQIGLTALTSRSWNMPMMGLRGAVWFALIWGAFAVGVVFGIWCYAAS